MNISFQNVFWLFIIVTLTMFGYVIIDSKIEEVKLQQLYDDAEALIETNGGLDQPTLKILYTMANSKGFFPAFLEVYNIPEDPIGNTSASLVYFNPNTNLHTYHTPIYIELRYPKLPIWFRVTQILGLSGTMPYSGKIITSGYGKSERPDWQ